MPELFGKAFGGALTPLPIVFQGQELSLMFLFGGVIVFLSGIIGATQLFHHFKLARLSGIFFSVRVICNLITAFT